MYYIQENGKVLLADESQYKLIDTIKFMPQYQELDINFTDKNIVLYGGEFYFEDDPVYIAKKEQDEKERIDNLFLTPSDVERALYKAKNMDFEDLKALIAQQIPTIDIKALAIEFRAKDFFRGAVAGGMRLFDVVGALLGYSPADMDYLFEHKELPSVEPPDNIEEAEGL